MPYHDEEYDYFPLWARILFWGFFIGVIGCIVWPVVRDFIHFLG